MFKLLQENMGARIGLYIFIGLVFGFFFLYLDTITDRNSSNYGAPLTGVLVIDLTGEGLNLTEHTPQTKTFFDIDADGFAEQTAWIAGQNAFLVVDNNGDGKINDTSELFGSISADGYEKIEQFDSDKNRRINKNDGQWQDLKIWHDLNNDAHNQPDELKSLPEAGIETISLKSRREESIVSDNKVLASSEVQIEGFKNAKIYLVNLKYDQINSYSAQDYTLDIRTLFLPTLRGFGDLPDVHIAGSINKELIKKIQRLAMEWRLESFGTPATTQSRVEDILFEWAQVSDMSADSRGPHIDARKLVFLEKLLGRKFLQQGASPDPDLKAAVFLNVSWYRTYHRLKAHLLSQLGAQVLYKKASYNPFKGDMDGDLSLSEEGLKQIEKLALASGNNAKVVWLEVADYIHYTKGLDKLTQAETVFLENAVSNSKTTIKWGDLASQILQEKYQ